METRTPDPPQVAMGVKDTEHTKPSSLLQPMNAFLMLFEGRTKRGIWVETTDVEGPRMVQAVSWGTLRDQ